MNIYSIMGYTLNFPKSFEYDKNNLPYVKLDADLNNGKTISYLKPLQSRLIGFNDDINFKNKKEVLDWAKENLKLCNVFSINKIEDKDWHFNFILLPKVVKNQYQQEEKENA